MEGEITSAAMQRLLGVNKVALNDLAKRGIAIRGKKRDDGMNTFRLHGIGCAMAVVIMGTTTGGASGAGPFLSGNDLYTSCTSPGDHAECIGYVGDVLDTADYEGIFYKGNSNLHAAVEGLNVEWCPPPGITSGQAADVATKFLRDNPQGRHERASNLIAQAMKAAWPCTK